MRRKCKIRISQTADAACFIEGVCLGFGADSRLRPGSGTQEIFTTAIIELPDGSLLNADLEDVELLPLDKKPKWGENGFEPRRRTHDGRLY